MPFHEIAEARPVHVDVETRPARAFGPRRRERAQRFVARERTRRPAARRKKHDGAESEVGRADGPESLARAGPRSGAIHEALGREQARARPREKAHALGTVGTSAEDLFVRRKEIGRTGHDASGRDELHVPERRRQEAQAPPRDRRHGRLHAAAFRRLGGGAREVPGERRDVPDGRIEHGEKLERVARTPRPVAGDDRRAFPEPERAAERRARPGVAGSVRQRRDERAHHLGRPRLGAGVPRPREGPESFVRVGRHDVRRE